MLKLISLALALAFASPAFAEKCGTLADVQAAIKKEGVPDSAVTLTEDAGFISAYHKAMGLTIPDGSQPTKFIMVVMPPSAAIGIVEPDGCILHYARVPLERHLTAVQSATSGV